MGADALARDAAAAWEAFCADLMISRARSRLHVPPATEVSTRSVGAQVWPRPYLLTNHNTMTPRMTARNAALTILTSTITCFRERITGPREPR